MLVPEISLTPMMERVFKERFHDEVAKLIFSHENTKEKAQKLAQKRNISYFCSRFELTHQ